MSLILDALRKSERTRQQTLTGQLSASDAAPRRARIPVPWATLIGILLVANALVLTIIFWHAHTSNSAAAIMETQAPVKATATLMAAPVYRPAIRSLAAEAAVDNPTAAATVVIPNTVSANAASIAPATTPAETASSVPTHATSAPLSSAATSVSIDDVPPLDSLPLEFQQSLPPLHLDVHGYAQKPADRFVVINMQRYQTGDTLKEGPKIIAITPQGVVLDYNGQRFLLPRL
ncbi:MAG: general secretion pathway protein GspB [Gammaproteobacteria bacterium]